VHAPPGSNFNTTIFTPSPGLPMEVKRRRVVDGVTSNSSNRVPLEQLAALEQVAVPADDPKFSGYKGCSVQSLCGNAKSGTTGVFVASDGLTTVPIPLEVLVRGILMMSDAQGQPLTQGGPLRSWFPADAGLVCGSGNNLSVKDVRSLELTSAPPPPP